METEFHKESVRCAFQVVRMWEQPPELLLQSPALLPLAVLCQAGDTTGLLSQVAAEVAKIEVPEEQEEISGCAQLLAGLRFNVDVVRSLFRGGFMRESVVFQEIFQQGRNEGKQEGRVEGKQEGELAMIYRLLPRRIGTVAPELQQRLLPLSVPQLEDLGEALLDFSEPDDLIAWLEQLPDS